MPTPSGNVTFELHEVQRPFGVIDRILRPETVQDALIMLRDHPGARPVAGGTDLLLDIQRVGDPAAPVVLVDLTTINEFREIETTDHSFVLAGGVTHNQVVMHPGIKEKALALSQACVEIGSPQLRNRATLAGNLATASPANDSISALMALSASVEIQRIDGQDNVSSRTVAVEDFFQGFRETVLQPDELITSITVPQTVPGASSIWVKLGLRKAQAISVVHAGIVVETDSVGHVLSARLALGSVAPTVVVVPEFANSLVGHRLEDYEIASAAVAAAEAVVPITDGRATAEYRNDTIEILIARSLEAIRDGTVASQWLEEPPTLSTEVQLSSAAPVGKPELRPNSAITLEVNGSRISAPGAELTLLDWIRDRAGAHPDYPLSGVKEGCAEGECGACTVKLNGAAVMSCLVAAGQADAGTVVSVEGLSKGDSPRDMELHPLQEAFVDEFAVQCGFCIPGFLVAGARLLEENSNPTEQQIKLALSGNLCRCTGYYPIIEAVRSAGEGGGQ